MNQPALMSIIIGGTVAKPVQPLSSTDASSVNMQMQGLLLASIEASHARYSMSQSHDINILKVLLITSAARCTDLHNPKP